MGSIASRNVRRRSNKPKCYISERSANRPYTADNVFGAGVGIDTVGHQLPDLEGRHLFRDRNAETLCCKLCSSFTAMLQTDTLNILLPHSTEDSHHLGGAQKLFPIPLR